MVRITPEHLRVLGAGESLKEVTDFLEISLPVQEKIRI